MITILRWINRAITALPLLIHTRTWYLLTHSHLLRVGELVLKLILLIGVATLTSTFVCRRHIGHTDGISGLWIDAYSAGILYATLNTLMIYIGPRVHWGLYFARLHYILSRSTTLSCPYRWHSKSTSLRYSIRLHVLHLLRLRRVGHSGTLTCSSTSHFLEWVVSTVSLTLRLIRCAKPTTCPFWLLLTQADTLWILLNIILMLTVLLLILLYIVNLNVIETIVEITHI